MAPRAPSDSRVLLLHGEESFLVEEEARRVLDAWQAELVSDFGFEALDPGALNATKLRDAVRQLPFLDPYRVIAVRSLAVRRADGLAAGLKDVPDTTRILITISGRLGAGSALGKAVAAAEQGLAREFPRLKGRALSDWASARARGVRLPPATARTPSRPASRRGCFAPARPTSGSSTPSCASSRPTTGGASRSRSE